MKLWNVSLVSSLAFAVACEKSPDMDLPQPSTGVLTLASRKVASVGEGHGEHGADSERAAHEAGPKFDRAKLGAFLPLVGNMESAKNPITTEKVDLGRKLFFDTRMSQSHDLSCNSCHNLTLFGADGGRVSKGHKGQEGTRNSPTVYNAAGHFVQFWDGRVDTIEEQAKKQVLNPVAMGMTGEQRVLETLKSIPQYVDAFKKAFPGEKDATTYANFGNAIGAFERTLTTPSRWDKFLQGEDDALTPKEKEGLSKFIDIGCPNCHTGKYMGGSMFQKLGLLKEWTRVNKDQGRFQETKNRDDMYFFKVPSLRNIEKTAPYLHDGTITTLEEAVKLMAFHQLGKELTDAEVASIVTFLKSLTGTIPEDRIKLPELPPSTAKTPKPDPK